MKIELFITKERVPFIVDELGANRVTVSEHDATQDKISFELEGAIDVLCMFHAGFRCGSDSMAKIITR
jgi:hypothetical protein